jgi:predicted lipoprotein with Yx(FWY)xxD motif
MKRTRTAAAALALTALLGMTACARPAPAGVADLAADAGVPEPSASVTPSDDVPPELQVIPSTSSTSSPSSPSSPSEPAGQGAASTTEDAVKPPTVAKTQKWVKIFSGPSDKDITPPARITSGSKTVELNATENDEIGTYVTDGAGRTLYRFDEDDNKPPKATCNGDCAKTWPPLLIKSPGKIFPKGLDPKILGYVERADGHCQVTINGWPVYYFAKDGEPGDIKGQGVKGTWFAVAPDGGKTQLPDSDAGSGTGGGTGADDEGPIENPPAPGY